MTITSAIDYGAPFDPDARNGKDLALHGWGVVSGLEVTASGLTATVAAGSILDRKYGALHTEDSTTTLTATAADSTNPRYDVIVLEWTYEESVSSTAALIKIVDGTPAASPSPPTLASNQTLIAVCYMPASASSWSVITPAAYVARGYNWTMENDWDTNGYYRCTVVDGSLPIFREEFDRYYEAKRTWVIPGGTYADGADIEWGDPTHEIGNTDKIFIPALAFTDYDASCDYSIQNTAAVIGLASGVDDVQTVAAIRIPKGRYEIDKIELHYKETGSSSAVALDFHTTRCRTDTVDQTDSTTGDTYTTSGYSGRMGTFELETAGYDGITLQEDDLLHVFISRRTTNDTFSGTFYIYGVTVTLKVS